MVFDDGIDSPFSSTAEPRLGCNSLSFEQALLVEFVQCLSSYSTICEPGFVGVDETKTRQEAQLLMSLLSSPNSKHNTKNVPSSVEASLFNRSKISRNLKKSDTSSLLRNSFSFTCPSLSLETKAEIAPDRCLSSSIENSAPSPMLLGRPLTVDDRDALRLSSDAMARNISNSFRTAIESRVQVWIEVLTMHLVHNENEMLKKGSHTEDIKGLLETSEAALIRQLRRAGDSICVTGVRTSFQVLPEKVEFGDDFCSNNLKRQRISNGEVILVKSVLEERDHYHYTVSHCLKFECTIYFTTPAGFSEISIEVPGIIEGTFFSSSEIPGKLSSVKVDVDTSILAAMLEKSCRQLVRASVEVFLEAEHLEKLPEFAMAMGKCGDKRTARKQTSATRPTFTSHTCLGNDPLVLVTPVFSDVLVEENYKHSSASLLMPIPDDLTGTISVEEMPHRISPHPSSRPEHVTPNPMICGSASLLPRQNSILPSSLESSKSYDHHMTNSVSNTYRLPLISPLSSETYFREVTLDHGPLLPSYRSQFENTPSLPMLVEAACRAMKTE